MGWDRKRRGAGGGYYYLSVRTPAGTRKVYLGRGAVAHLAAADVVARKERRRAAKRALAAEREATREADRLAADLLGWVDHLAAAWLVLTGHHKHGGAWRRKRGRNG